VIAREHEVTVASTQASDAKFSDFVLLDDAQKRKAELREIAQRSDVVVIQGLVLVRFPFLLRAAKHLVVDLYDPYLFEYLAHPHPQHADWGYLRQVYRLNQQLMAGDFFLCANPTQRDYWMGSFSALGRLNLEEHEQDSSFRRLIDIVPFGLPAEAPRHTARVMRGLLPGIGSDDFVLLWAGGIWQWLDPLTVIRGVAAAVQEDPKIRLVFLGTQDPNPNNRPMMMAEQARRLAGDLGLIDKQVFFAGEWVAYEDRQNWLLESDIGISAHQDTAEARFSFRTRVLDYIWAGLPTILTAGDYFSDWVAQQGAGEAVPAGDVEAWKRAILRLARDPAARAKMKTQLQSRAPEFTWERAAQPLSRYCAKPYKTARPPAFRQRLAPLLSAVYDSAKRRG
jgi:glycosyltransferase involved in cell wall biosynthesis